MNRIISTPGVTVGLYSPAVTAAPGQDLVMISGVLAVDRAGASVGVGDFETQMRTVFTLLGEVLDAAGSSFGGLCKMTTYLVDAAHVEEFYRVRAEIFPTLFPQRNYPGNTLLVIQRLVRPEFLIEIEGVATAPAHAEEVSDVRVG